jgi:lipopolysaccharide/colanic/teichoic acid biosynthesis glycosyltransferase
MRNGKIGRSMAAQDLRSLRGIYDTRQTAALLRRERARADRQGRSVALVVFHIEGSGRRSRDLLRLAKLIQRQVRTTDEVGWFDDERVCAILSDTEEPGAWIFAHRLCEEARGRKLRATCEVFVYPGSDQAQNDSGKDDAGTTPRSGGGRRSAEPSLPDQWNTPGDTYLAPQSASATAVLEAPESAAKLRSAATPVQAGPARAMESLFVRRTPLWKRTIDVVAAGTALIVLSPILLACAMLVKLTSPGEVIFRQPRRGLGGRVFTIYKFRTMVTDAEARRRELLAMNEQDGPAFKIRKDPRITPVGRFLRCTSLDELPQLWNVVKGDMSLVGPRPLPVHEADGCDQWHRSRLDVAPGLTCIWQVKGRSRVTFDEWMRMDLSYASRRRLWEDIKIVLATIPAVLLRKGAS